MTAIANGIDEQLLVEAAQLDPGRFAELYENNFNRVYAYVAHRVRDRDEAEDVTAEVFHQALANLGKFEWRGVPFVGWLLGIAANVLASRWRHPSEREVPAEAMERAETGVEDGMERRTLLLQLLETLPADQRYVLARRFADQRSVREIAQELGRSEGAVKQLQFRAVQTLRARVRGTHDHPVVH